MTTAVTERSSLGKISWNRMIAKSRASGNVARRDGLPEYVEPWSVSGPLYLYMERVIEVWFCNAARQLRCVGFL